MFGSINIFIPELKDKLYSNKDVFNIMSDTGRSETDNVNDLVNGYEEYTIVDGQRTNNFKASVFIRILLDI